MVVESGDPVTSSGGPQWQHTEPGFRKQMPAAPSPLCPQEGGTDQGASAPSSHSHAPHPQRALRPEERLGGKGPLRNQKPLDWAVWAGAGLEDTLAGAPKAGILQRQALHGNRSLFMYEMNTPHPELIMTGPEYTSDSNDYVTSSPSLARAPDDRDSGRPRASQGGLCRSLRGSEGP